MAVSRGDDWNGDESVFRDAFCKSVSVTDWESAWKLLHSMKPVTLTLGDVVGWCQLGEFRLFSIGDISDNGRGIALLGFNGDDPGVPLLMRSGWTWWTSVRVSRLSQDGQCQHTGSDAMLSGQRISSYSESML